EGGRRQRRVLRITQHRARVAILAAQPVSVRLALVQRLNFRLNPPTDNTMKTRVTLLTVAVASLSAFAADFTGTWKAEFETQRGLQKYTFNLKQDGATVTGKATVDRDGEKREAEFKDGK